MPNIKSAKKRVLVNNKKTELNKNIRSAVKTAIKKVELFVKEGNSEQAYIALNDAFSAIDAATTKKIYHKNNAANKKAKLAKKVQLAFGAKEAKAEKIEQAKVVEAPIVEEVEVEEEKPVKKTTRKTTTKKAETEAKPARKTTKKVADAE